MIRKRCYNNTTNKCWPRTSGDDPDIARGAPFCELLAPHERG